MKIRLNSAIYPLEAILNACYCFIDRAYIYLDANCKKETINIFFKGKSRLSEKELSCLRGEFMNELLHCALRYRISKENKKVREYIVGRALYSASGLTEDSGLSGKKAEELDYKKDSLGIAIPWEKKYGKIRKNAKPKV